MNVIIMEDEKPAAEKLAKTLHQLNNTLQVKAVLGSVKETARWLAEQGFPDLIFMDIELSDGASFQLFSQVEIQCPVIFTTAYDEYWQEAFEYNGLDYLLKPVKEEKLAAALKKYEKLKAYFSAYSKKLTDFSRMAHTGPVRKRFLVKRGADYISIKAENIAYFYATHKLVCLVNTEGQKFILDQSLADIESQTDPALFYRVNRKYLVNLNAIKRIKTIGKGRLALELLPAVEEEIIISQEAAPPFKQWLEQ